jgi:hypothetical protein
MRDKYQPSSPKRDQTDENQKHAAAAAAGAVAVALELLARLLQATPREDSHSCIVMAEPFPTGSCFTPGR